MTSIFTTSAHINPPVQPPTSSAPVARRDPQPDADADGTSNECDPSADADDYVQCTHAVSQRAGPIADLLEHIHDVDNFKAVTVVVTQVVSGPEVIVTSKEYITVTVSGRAVATTDTTADTTADTVADTVAAAAVAVTDTPETPDNLDLDLDLDRRQPISFYYYQNTHTNKPDDDDDDEDDHAVTVVVTQVVTGPEVVVTSKEHITVHVTAEARAVATETVTVTVADDDFSSLSAAAATAAAPPAAAPQAITPSPAVPSPILAPIPIPTLTPRPRAPNPNPPTIERKSPICPAAGTTPNNIWCLSSWVHGQTFALHCDTSFDAGDPTANNRAVFDLPAQTWDSYARCGLLCTALSAECTGFSYVFQSGKCYLKQGEAAKNKDGGRHVEGTHSGRVVRLGEEEMAKCDVVGKPMVGQYVGLSGQGKRSERVVGRREYWDVYDGDEKELEGVDGGEGLDVVERDATWEGERRGDANANVEVGSGSEAVTKRGLYEHIFGRDDVKSSEDTPEWDKVRVDYQ